MYKRRGCYCMGVCVSVDLMNVRNDPDSSSVLLVGVVIDI